MPAHRKSPRCAAHGGGRTRELPLPAVMTPGSEDLPECAFTVARPSALSPVSPTPRRATSTFRGRRWASSRTSSGSLTAAGPRYASSPDSGPKGVTVWPPPCGSWRSSGTSAGSGAKAPRAASPPTTRSSTFRTPTSPTSPTRPPSRVWRASARSALRCPETGPPVDRPSAPPALPLRARRGVQDPPPWESPPPRRTALGRRTRAAANAARSAGARSARRRRTRSPQDNWRQLAPSRRSSSPDRAHRWTTAPPKRHPGLRPRHPPRTL